MLIKPLGGGEGNLTYTTFLFRLCVDDRRPRLLASKNVIPLFKVSFFSTLLFHFSLDLPEGSIFQECYITVLGL